MHPAHLGAILAQQTLLLLEAMRTRTAVAEHIAFWVAVGTGRDDLAPLATLNAATAYAALGQRETAHRWACAAIARTAAALSTGRDVWLPTWFPPLHCFMRDGLAFRAAWERAVLAARGDPEALRSALKLHPAWY